MQLMGAHCLCHHVPIACMHMTMTSLNDIVELVRHSDTQICTAACCGSDRRCQAAHICHRAASSALALCCCCRKQGLGQQIAARRRQLDALAEQSNMI